MIDFKEFGGKKILILILLLAFFLRLFRIWYPDAYVFDEVYHAFTAKEYLKGSKEAWEWWTTPPPGVAYEWTHPPLAKEIMTTSMFIFHSTDPWAYRVPGVFVNVLAIYVVYQLSLQLFKNQKIALISAFVFSLDGLNFVQSRTGMNDAYLVTFILTSLLFFVRKKIFWASVFCGLALASKWAAIYLFVLLALLILINDQTNFIEKIKKLSYFLIIPPMIYLASYLPFFWLGHTFDQFLQLQQQMWWYHTHLKAAHDYASNWWSWPLNLYPVWYYVQYFPNGHIANIFASGNLVAFILGIVAIFLSLIELFKTKSKALTITLFGFFIFWLPWAVSPRIMFLYHYSPSVAFFCLALGYQLDKLNKNDRKLLIALLSLVAVGFLLFYPILTGVVIPRATLKLFFFTNLTKNPFGPL